MRKYCLIILIFLAKQHSVFANDTCTLKASFYPGRDTLAVINFNAVFNNTTVGATSYTWLRDGIAVNSPAVYNYSTSKVGTNEVALAVSNGICVDTARVYVVLTGTPPVTHEYYKLALNVENIESQARAIVRINNEENILGGYIKYHAGEAGFIKRGFLAAVSDIGCVRWSIQTEGNEEHTVNNLKKASNGDIFAMLDSRILIRLDADGNQRWAKHLPQTGAFPPASNDLLEDSDGNVLLFYGGIAGHSVFKIDANGNTIWGRSYAVPNNQTVVPNAMVYLNGSYYICGALVTVTNQGGNANNQSFLSKINISTGATQWTKVYSGPGATFMTGCRFIITSC